MLQHLSIADINMNFKSRESVFSGFWLWKLDPYVKNFDSYAQGPDNHAKHASFTVDFTQNEEVMHNELDAEMLPLLKKEHSGFFFRVVYDLGENGTLWEMRDGSSNDCCLSFTVSKNWDEIRLLQDNTNSGKSAAFEYLTHIMPGVFLKDRMLSFHSALIEYNNYAFAICANSGVGKTTRARLWRDLKRALILNGDRTVCRRTNRGWKAYGTPWSGTSGEQINRSAPLRAIIVLQRAEENFVTRLSPREALPYVIPHLFYPEWDEKLVNIAMTEFDHLLTEVPVLLLNSRPDAESVEVLEKALEELV